MTKLAGTAFACAFLLLLLLCFANLSPDLLAQGETGVEAAQIEAASDEEVVQAEEQEEPESRTTYTLPPEKHEKAVAYARARNRLYFISIGWGIAVVLLILFAAVHLWRRRLRTRRPYAPAGAA